MILREGVTCWQKGEARRAAYLIDAAAYFAALRDVMARAERSIFIVGWDVDSRTRLVPEPKDGHPAQLLGFLNSVLERRPQLRAYVLCWDFSMIYTFEREKLPTYRFGWEGHERLQFRLDGMHPVAASHHQKIVVVDDQIAFAGGLDLTIRRWDTPDHAPKDPARVDPAGVGYAPMHDVQMVVEGPAARVLGQLVRERWWTATGEELPPAPSDALPVGENGGMARDLWPAGLTADVTDVPIAVSRTKPPLPGSDAGAAQEVLALTLEAIAAAKRSIYIENQYLTAASVVSALTDSLRRTEGPEIVIVLPREECGWLERSTMGVLRGRAIRRLQAADAHGRLRLYHPVVPGISDACINVHSKVMIVDDNLVRVGSANLSNRSMGLDSECDLAFEADGDPTLARSAALLRNRLLGEHLGCPAEVIEARIAERGSLIAAVESLRGGPRSLEPLDCPVETDPNGINLALLDGLVCDPEQPAADAFLDRAIPGELRRPLRRSLLRIAILIAVVAGIAAVWRMTPLRDYLEPRRLAELSKTIGQYQAAPLIVLGGYLAGGLLLFPITLLLTATALVFPPWTSIVYSLIGTMASAAMTFGIGRLLGRNPPRWLLRPRIARLRRQLGERGLLAVIATRLLPVGNFTLINIIAGAVPVRFRHFMLGNAIGVLPGILGLSIFADRLGSTFRDPKPANVVVLAAVVLAFVGTIEWLRRRIQRTPAGKAVAREARG